MKKKKIKNNIPSYAFGIDQLSNYAGATSVLGSAVSGLSDEESKGSVAGSTIQGLGSGAAAGAAFGPIGAGVGAVVGGLTSFFTARKKKNMLEEKRRREATMNKTQLGMNSAANAELDYWDDNALAYTYENGGMLPNLAYLDNNEIIRDNAGGIYKVPNNKPGTDNHLVDSTNLESVLSDKLKRPGTKNTFAKEGQILAKMTKPSKGKDKFAENTNRLNKINANRMYNQLLAEQEEVKAKKGIKPKVKGIPAYENGMTRLASGVYVDKNNTLYNPYGGNFRQTGRYPRRDGNAGYMLADGTLFSTTGVIEGVEEMSPNYVDKWALDMAKEKLSEQNLGVPKVELTKPATKIYDPVYSREPLDKTPYVTEWNPEWSKALEAAIEDSPKLPKNSMQRIFNRSTATDPLSIGSPTTGAWFSYPETRTSYNFVEPAELEITEPTVDISEVTPSTKSNKKVQAKTPSTVKPTPAEPKIIKTTTERLAEPTMPLVNTKMAIDWDNVVTPVDIPASADEAVRKRARHANESKAGYSPDWLSLAPTVYNTLQALRGPEKEPLTVNPYMNAVRSTMAKRRMNVEPARLANSRSRALSNYNLANLNANTGANLAARTQSAIDEYAANANLYANKQNADNAYLGEYANTLNNLGQQFEQSVTRYNDLNARNRAAARNFGATATSQLGKWSQVNRMMKNQYNRDQMLMPLLSNFLSQGYTQKQVDDLLATYRNN